MNQTLSTRLVSARMLRVRLQRHWAASPARRWLRLWLDELRDMLPAGLRARFAGPRIAHLAWPLPDAVDTSQPRILLLDAAQVLVQRLTLPVAATRDLPGMLGYEIDRYTPFTRDQVHFAARIEQIVSGRARVLLVAIDRERLQAMLESCAARGLTLAGIQALDHQRRPLEVDLLPDASRAARGRHSRLDQVLGWGCAGLLLTLMLLILDGRAAAVQAMRGEVQAQREQLRQLQTLRNELANTQGAGRYLAGLKAARPTVSALLAELTGCLGDDTWVEHMEVAASGELSFSGQSRQASALIGLMKNCSSIDGVQFQGVIQPDAQSGQDRFSLRARLKENAEHAPTTDPA